MPDMLIDGAVYTYADLLLEAHFDAGTWRMFILSDSGDHVPGGQTDTPSGFDVAQLTHVASSREALQLEQRAHDEVFEELMAQYFWEKEQ